MAVDRPLINQKATVISGTRSAPFVVSQERATRALDVCTCAPYETGANESGRAGWSSADFSVGFGSGDALVSPGGWAT
jgi:hypothetical protein